jgi:hypothetical protein
MYLRVENTLAYLRAKSITGVKSFKLQALPCRVSFITFVFFSKKVRNELGFATKFTNNGNGNS